MKEKQTQDEMLQEFTERINVIAQQPDGERNLAYIEMIMRDPEAFDFAYSLISPFLDQAAA